MKEAGTSIITGGGTGGSGDGFSRYIRQRHMDYAASANDATAISGTGASVASAVNTGTTNAGHPGCWAFIPASTAGGYSCLKSSTVNAEFNLSVVNKLAFRAVLKTTGTLFSGAVGAATYGEFLLGWSNTPNTLPVASQNLILWRFAPSISANWILTTADGTTLNSSASTSNVALAINTWYDLRIYSDATGVIGKVGVYGGTLFSTGLITANIPSGSTMLYWQIANMNGTAGTTQANVWLDLYEIIAEASNPMMLGDQLVTNF